MTIFKQLLLGLACSFLLAVNPVSAENLTIVTPYCGTEYNTYAHDQYGLVMKDSAPIQGLYIQSIDSAHYQWNLFLYQSSDINQSDLQGFNFIYDRYFGSDESGKNVLGIGMNYLKMEMEAEDLLTSAGPLEGINMDLSVTSLYLRFGRYFNFGQDPVRCSILPWIGGELDRSRGSGLVDFPGPGSMGFPMNDDQFSWIAGVNFKASFSYFLQVEAKHSLTYHGSDFFDRSSAMVNLFFTRNLGLSYRYNVQETSTGKDRYIMGGMAFLF